MASWGQQTWWCATCSVDVSGHLPLCPSAYDRKGDLVFANDLGGLLDPRNVVSRHCKPALKAAELPTSIRLYDLRHTHATLLLHQGVNVKVVSQRLGHASAAMTLDRYTHVLAEGQEQAVAALEALMGSG